MNQARSFSQLQRYELKYHISLEDVPLISAFLEPWCSLDAHSEKSTDGFYWVSSLYLDSPQYTFWNWKEHGVESRFNMRIRTYGENPDPAGPRYFEVKAKQGDVVNKTRGTLLQGHPERLWKDTAAVMAMVTPKDRKNLEGFLARSLQYNAAPCILTQYRRRAWFGKFEDYSRVTVDTQLRWREERGFDYSVDSRYMRPTDIPEYFTPGTNAILELKCTRREVPWWMLDLIRCLNLQRRSFSKYGSAIRQYLHIPSLPRSQPSQESFYA
jgi:hypothetical protein